MGKLPAFSREEPLARVDNYMRNSDIVDAIWNINTQRIECIL